MTPPLPSGALRALLAGPFAGRGDVPAALLAAAAASEDAEAARAALTHPACPAALRAETLRAASDGRLARLAEDAGPFAADGVIAELRRRTPEPPPMTAEPRDGRSAAWAVLVEADPERIPEAVFDAAVRLLPGPPAQHREGESVERWMREHRAARAAWRAMWLELLRRHRGRQRRLSALLEGSPAQTEIRHLLMDELVDSAEPELLTEVALADLAQFAGAVLTTRVCREIRAGLAREAARERFADELAALPDEARRLPEAYLGDLGLDMDRGAGAAAHWMASAAGGRWRTLLRGPAEGWPLSEEARVGLARRFAETAAEALALWEPEPGRPVGRVDQLRWVAVALGYLPSVEGPLRERLRALVADARRGRHLRRGSRKFDDALAVIERAVAEVPAAPEAVSPHELAHAPEGVLGDYLDRHAGDDALVEKALLSFALGRRGDFAAVLSRHSAPAEALPRLTLGLRRLLADGPGAEAWTRAALSAPGCAAETIRALPAWAAMSDASPEVTALVAAAIGDDPTAWERLAASPIGPEGPHAWRRLGDILDAARDATPWPKAPAA
ncbi:hypothetical protein [Streptomyces radicis]|uniref:hypothetical protein n=1 Tax=Streptomyces radicis TaxID=1750517 RepID=UPI0016027DF2|nr:hypothetical protein [Streptomyces radicis]